MTSAPLKVFLSYVQADDGADFDDPAKSFMRRLHTDLTAQGYTVWWDRVTLPARGLAFSKEIEEAIRGVDRLVLVVTPGVPGSKYVQAEVECALKLCKPITPILKAGDYNLLPASVARINTLDFRPPREYAAAFADLHARLDEPAPFGRLFNVKPLPTFHLMRETPYNAAHKALCADAIAHTVISTRATAVYGPGGLGKSTLAAALAHDCTVRRMFPDGVIWLEVGQKPIPTQLQAQIGATVFNDSRDRYQTEQDGRLALAQILRDKHALIVLDDVWDHGVVSWFPIEETANRLLITTRSGGLARRIQGEDIQLEILSPLEGAALIAGRAGGDANNADYQQIARVLGGHTLAIRLAAEQLALGYADDAADLLRMLSKPEKPFAALKLSDDDKDENVELSLSLSYAALKPDLQRRYRALGVLPIESTFDLPLLAALWSDEDPDDARAPLRTLLDNGLLDAAGDNRTSQHRLLRAYARALLTGAGELEPTFGRYADYVIEQAKQFDTLPREQWNQLDALLPHVSETGERLTDDWEHAATPDDDLTRRCGDFAYNVTQYVTNRPQMIDTPRGRERLGLRWLDMGLNVSRKTGDQAREALFCNDIGFVWSALGEKRKALDYYEQALPLRRAVGNRGGEATTLNNIGRVWDDVGEKRRALEYFEQALQLYRAVGNRDGEAVTLTNIGEIWRTLGEPRKALDYYEQVLPLRRVVGNRGGEATTLNNIGAVWDDVGEKRKALDYYEQALPLYRAVGDRGGEAATLNNIGEIWRTLGEPRKALEYYEQALPLRRAVSDRGGEAITLNNMAAIHYGAGVDNAAAILQQIIPIFHDLGAVGEEAAILVNLAAVYEKMGKIDDAIQSAEAGIAILIQYNLPQDAAGYTIAQYDAFLVRLRGKRG